MKIKKYQIDVYDSVLDYIHASSRTITEYYIPEYMLHFNLENDTINVFTTTDSSRKDAIKKIDELEDIEISGELVFMIKRLYEDKEYLRGKLLMWYDRNQDNKKVEQK